jgi:hypothetical protein
MGERLQMLATLASPRPLPAAPQTIYRRVQNQQILLTLPSGHSNHFEESIYGASTTGL